jgi:hypothetical protein
MTTELAEQLKREWTDTYVVVVEDVKELRRFVGLTGQVKTVNMSGRALVQFDGPEDIGWYDIDPAYLTTVEAPVPKKPAAAAKEVSKPASAEKKPKAAAKKGMSPLELARAQGAAGAKTSAAPKEKKAGLSPLELARQQGAAGSGGSPTAPEKKGSAAASGQKLSPLELARQQGAVGSGGSKAASEATSAATSKKEQSAAASGKKLSPLELARQQGAFKGDEASSSGESPSAATAEPVADDNSSDVPEETEAVVEQADANKESAQPAKTPTTGPDGKPLSPLELARLQGPFKG